VRTTVRSLKREGDVREMLKVGGAERSDRLSFIAADLEYDQGWPEAVAGCEYVPHVASPLPANVPKHEDELIVPARDGALRVLRGNAKARRVLGWTPRSNEESILAAAESLVRLGLLTARSS
jgi:hypothetical protein